MFTGTFTWQLTTAAKAEQGVLNKKIRDLSGDVNALQVQLEGEQQDRDNKIRVTKQAEQRTQIDVKKLKKKIADQVG